MVAFLYCVLTILLNCVAGLESPLLSSHHREKGSYHKPHMCAPMSLCRDCGQPMGTKLMIIDLCSKDSDL